MNSTIRITTQIATPAQSATSDDQGSIHVVDQGPGIPSELLTRLFVPFDRLGADAGREGGAGLGLVLARRLTEAMNGTFELASVVGVGTHITITFATVQASEPSARS